MKREETRLAKIIQGQRIPVSIATYEGRPWILQSDVDKVLATIGAEHDRQMKRLRRKVSRRTPGCGDDPADQ